MLCDWMKNKNDVMQQDVLKLTPESAVPQQKIRINSARNLLKPEYKKSCPYGPHDEHPSLTISYIAWIAVLMILIDSPRKLSLPGTLFYTMPL